MTFSNYLTIPALVLMGAFTLGGCGEDDSKSSIENLDSVVERTINNVQYRFEGNKVTQLTEDEDDIAKYAVLSDIHGQVERALIFAKTFKKQGVDGFIIPGDIVLNERLRYGRNDSRDDQEEIEQVLEAIAELGLPIFVIAGNHEKKTDYQKALANISKDYDNVIDMTKYRIFDGDDIDFVSMSGYQTFSIPGRQFIPDDGHYADPEYIEQTGKLREGLDDPVILITHGAGKTNAKSSPATISTGRDVGDQNTTDMMQKYDIPFSVVGHIHEAGGIAATWDGTNIRPGEWAQQFTANFGTMETWKYLNGVTYNGMAGVLTVKGFEAKYDTLVLE